MFTVRKILERRGATHETCLHQFPMSLLIGICQNLPRYIHIVSTCNNNHAIASKLIHVKMYLLLSYRIMGKLFLFAT